MTTYGLVHGAWASGAQWKPLAEELGRRGHVVVAPDLPVEDASATFSDYARAVVAALADAGEDVVLVAHSMGGISAPLAAAERPVRSLVFVAALLPQPGRPLAELFDAEPMVLPDAVSAPVRDGALRRWVDEDAARRTLWHDCDEPTARWAFGTLRGQAVHPYFEPWPLDALPAVPRRYVVCREDRVVCTPWSREAAPRLLGVEAEHIRGGHSPHVSRPAELADLLGA